MLIISYDLKVFHSCELKVFFLLAGFSRVFPMEKLHAFSPREIQLMLSGEQAPEWSYDDLMNYAEPKFGYTKESPGFIRLVNVLVNMNGEERKVLLYFFAVFITIAAFCILAFFLSCIISNDLAWFGSFMRY